MEENWDPNGHETLEGLEGAYSFNKWIYESIVPYCEGEILEIGSGIGNITSFFAADSLRITASDLRLQYLQKLKKKFPNIRCVRLDASSINFDVDYLNLFNRYDTVFALNVIEHIKDENGAIVNCYKLLKPGGKLIILVPAFQQLFNDYDINLGHFKRYTKKSLSELMTKNGSIEKVFYFNFVGIFGWYLSGRLSKGKLIPKAHIKLYNFLVPFFKLFDRIVLRTIGLSVVGIAKKRI